LLHLGNHAGARREWQRQTSLLRMLCGFMMPDEERPCGGNTRDWKKIIMPRCCISDIWRDKDELSALKI
jgi:hypothetical protein